MNKRAFTLIELLAVITILLVLAVVITPKIVQQINKSEEVAYNKQIEEIINTSKIYVNQNSNLLQEDINVITLQELKNSGLLNSSKVLNPITKEELTGCIIVRYTNNKYEYMYSEEENECNPIIVTFDSQGGTITKNTKNVIYGETYGNLPTPTREGYTFMGWNGKNKLAIPVEYATAKETRIIPIEEMFFVKAGNYVFTGTVSNATQWRDAIALKNINEEILSGNDYKPQSWFYYSNPYGIWLLGSDTSYTTRTYTITIKEDCYIRIMLMFGDASEATIVTDAQLEEGDTATPFEPYYITSDTTVVQDKNHTLKAIWKANE